MHWFGVCVCGGLRIHWNNRVLLEQHMIVFIFGNLQFRWMGLISLVCLLACC